MNYSNRLISYLAIPAVRLGRRLNRPGIGRFVEQAILSPGFATNDAIMLAS